MEKNKGSYFEISLRLAHFYSNFHSSPFLKQSLKGESFRKQVDMTTGIINHVPTLKR